jgi:SprT-like family.
MIALYTSVVEPTHQNCGAIQTAVTNYLTHARRVLGDLAVDKIKDVIIEFYAKGANAAVATVGEDEDGTTVGVIQFSMHHVRTRIHTMIRQVVPHELAHVICMANGWDGGHGKIWKRICKMLGGNGATFNTMGVVDGRYRWAYEASCGDGVFWLNAAQKRQAMTEGLECVGLSGKDHRLTAASLTGNIKPIEQLYAIYA